MRPFLKFPCCGPSSALSRLSVACSTRTPCVAAAVLLVLCGLVVTASAAGDEQAQAGPERARIRLADCTLEIPLPEGRAIPSWLGFPESFSEGGVSTVAIPIAPLTGQVPDLAVTIYFLDTEGAFVRVIWDSAGEQATLSRNLGEGVGTLHQRTILLSGSMLAQGGELLISAPAEVVPVNAVRFEWTRERRILSTADTPEIGLLDGGRILAPAEISGLPEPADEDQWQGWIITAPLIERVEPIEGGVEFVAEIESLPTQAALRGKLVGLRPDTEARIFVNGRDIGPAALTLPPLSDAGYGKDAAGRWYYAGWRDFAAFLPEGHLRPGENSIRIFWPAGAQGAEPVSVKGLALELRFEPGDTGSRPQPEAEADAKNDPATDGDSAVPTAF